jgi:hypothetical protein
VRARKEIKDEAHQLQDEEQEEWDRMEGEWEKDIWVVTPYYVFSQECVYIDRSFANIFTHSVTTT